MNFLRGVDVFISHHYAVVQSVHCTEFDTSGQPPAESPKDCSFTWNTDPHLSAAGKQQSALCDRGWQIAEMFEHSDGNNAVVLFILDLIDAPIGAANGMPVGRLFRELGQFLDDIVDFAIRFVLKVIQISRADFEGS